MGSERAYLSRLTTLFAVSSLIDAADEEMATKDLLPIALKLSKDGVPNVRFNAARTLHKLITKVDKRYSSNVVLDTAKFVFASLTP